MDKGPKYISQEQLEEFERFLLNQMELEEETIFHEKLEGDTILKNQFEEFKALLFAVEEDGLRKVLNDFHDTIPKKDNTSKSNFYLYRIAAGIAIIVALGLWFFNQQSPNDELFEEYFTPDPGLPTVMGSSENYDFYEAMVDYKQGNYQVAIEKWEKLLLAKPNNDTLNYFLGVAHLAGGANETAIPFLIKVSNSSSYFEKEARHYLGLAYLKKGEIDKAKTFLKEDDRIMNEISNE